jgi:hypothetical protein
MSIFPDSWAASEGWVLAPCRNSPSLVSITAQGLLVFLPPLRKWLLHHPGVLFLYPLPWWLTHSLDSITEVFILECPSASVLCFQFSTQFHVGPSNAVCSEQSSFSSSSVSLLGRSTPFCWHQVQGLAVILDSIPSHLPHLNNHVIPSFLPSPKAVLFLHVHGLSSGPPHPSPGLLLLLHGAPLVSLPKTHLTQGPPEWNAVSSHYSHLPRASFGTTTLVGQRTKADGACPFPGIYMPKKKECKEVYGKVPNSSVHTSTKLEISQIPTK